MPGAMEILMKSVNKVTGLRYGMVTAAKEHLAAGEPITRLEAMVLYGISNLTDMISEMRKQGWVIESRQVAYVAALARVGSSCPVGAACRPAGARNPTYRILGKPVSDASVFQ